MYVNLNVKNRHDIIIVFFTVNRIFFFVAEGKFNTKRNKTGSILYAPDSPPLNSF